MMIYTAKAFAKTNIFLKVLGKRPDGYHDIDTVMQSVSIYDEVSLELTKSDIVVFCDKEELSGEENIAAKAVRLFFDYAEISSGALIRINKRIPVAAGMGGGSADAAAVLILLNKATGKNYSVKELLPLAKKLGADVPFFLMGGCVRAQGIGEKLTQLDGTKMHFVFLKEGQKQSTAQMYAELDSLEPSADTNHQLLISALKDGKTEEVCKYMFNSFECCWDTDSMFKPFYEFEPLTTFISGSGPTVGAVFSSGDLAIRCAEALKSQGKNAFYATSIDCGIQIV